MNELSSRRPVAFFLVALVTATSGCGRATPEDRLVVFAASSLRDAFTSISAAFERAHPGADVTFNFAGTPELRTQLEHGAPVDVFASADTRHMAELARAHLVEPAVVFARNEPVVVVAREAAGEIRSFADLPAADRLVIGAPEVPIGRYTRQILDRAEATLGRGFRARVEAKVASRELNVRQVFARVTLGEAEAGIVYRTDVQAARDAVDVVTIPPEVNVIAEYPIAIAVRAAHPTLARAWIDFVLSPDGQGALEDVGFLPAPAGGAPP